jgi:hypothetical protein
MVARRANRVARRANRVAPARWHGVSGGGVKGEWRWWRQRRAVSVLESKRSGGGVAPKWSGASLNGMRMAVNGAAREDEARRGRRGAGKMRRVKSRCRGKMCRGKMRRGKTRCVAGRRGASREDEAHRGEDKARRGKMRHAAGKTRWRIDCAVTARRRRGKCEVARRMRGDSGGVEEDKGQQRGAVKR